MGGAFNLIFAKDTSVRELKSPLSQVVLSQHFVVQNSPPEEIDLWDELRIPNLFPVDSRGKFPKQAIVGHFNIILS